MRILGSERREASLQVESVGGWVRVRVWGRRIGVEEGRRLGAALERAIGEGARRIEVELPEAEWVSSVALGVVIRAWRLLGGAGGEVRVSGSEAVRERVERAGFGVLWSMGESRMANGEWGTCAPAEVKASKSRDSPVEVMGASKSRNSAERLSSASGIGWWERVKRWWKRVMWKRQVGAILRMYERGVSQAEIARRLGWSRQRVHAIVRRRARRGGRDGRAGAGA